MSHHPINLVLAFLLEIAALIATGYWGWTQHEGIGRIVLTIGVPVVLAAVWGVFRVNNDPNEALVEIPGWLRLILELGFFAIAAILLYAAGQPQAALIFAAVVVLHYVTSYDRVWWLLTGRR
jgi:hypothetical protein